MGHKNLRVCDSHKFQTLLVLFPLHSSVSSSSSSSSSMFCSLRNTLFQRSYINGGGDSSATHFLQFLLLQNPSLLRSRFISSTNHTSSTSSSFVVSYLMNSCGLSEDKAISASKKVHFETSSRPDSVIALFETHGFTKPYITKLITGLPALLLADPQKTLKPKLEFYISMGISGIDLAQVLSSHPVILQRSLENHIVPSIAFLKSILHSDDDIIAALKRSYRFIHEDPGKRIVPNIQLLRKHGVPESNIAKLLTTQPSVLGINVVRFEEIVEEVNRMDFDPLQFTFLLALRAFASLTNSNWEAKLDVFRRWGWSEDEIRTAFRKNPQFMMASEKKIMAIMDFLVNQMGFSASLMAEHPHILLFSLEKNIIPRCLVFRILVSKGLVEKKDFNISKVLRMVEKSFMEKYVIKYDQKVPELFKAYQGQLDCLELSINSEGVDGLKML